MLQGKNNVVQNPPTIPIYYKYDRHCVCFFYGHKKGGFTMKKYIWISIFTFTIFIFSLLFSRPSFNGTDPGCAGGGCHSSVSGVLVLTPGDNLEVTVGFTGVQGIGNIAGELVDDNNNVVDVVNSTSNSTFKLTAPSAGSYTVNAGYNDPSRRWEGKTVNLTVTGLEGSNNAIVPANIQLYANHPNPFNNETVIRFSVPQNSEAAMVLYNINGQIVRHLTEGKFAGGVNVVRWDGRDDAGQLVASGTYICQLKNENQQVSRKLILSK